MERAKSFGTNIRPLFAFKYEEQEDNTWAFTFDCFMADQSTWIKQFPTKEKMILAARTEIYNVLWYHLEKYVNHSGMIIKNSKHYVSPNVMQSLDQCRKFADWIASNIYQLDALVTKINQMHKHLHAILPHQNNDSHHTSLARLESIMIRANAIDQVLMLNIPACT